jgi:hypothetical protein
MPNSLRGKPIKKEGYMAHAIASKPPISEHHIDAT